jgi:hypothetical protein
MFSTSGKGAGVGSITITAPRFARIALPRLMVNALICARLMTEK